MSLPQQKFREIVFQLLYSHDLSNASESDMTPLLMAELSVTKKAVRTAQERVNEIIAKKQELDVLIAKASLSYAFERIPSVERNILRLGVFELLFDDTIPPKVSISEAMRLARKFSSPEAASFINAILDNLYKNSLGEAIDTKSFSQAVEALSKSEIIPKDAIGETPL
jgi:transcription antitermination protein NusB